jgi:hypothetical protein
LAHVHAAIASASADGAPRQALELSIALRSYWNSDDLSLSALISLEGALAETPTADAQTRCDAHELLSFGRGIAGCAPEAIAHAEAAVAAASDDRRRSLALARWVWSLYLAGRFEIPKLECALGEAAALAQRSGDVFAQATVLRMQSLVMCNLKLDYAGAEVLSARTRALWQRLGNRQMAYLSLLNQAMMWGKMGRGNEEAITVIGECERAARADGDWTGLITATRQLGRVHARMRRWDDAAAAFRRSVSVAWQRHAAQGLAQGLLHLPLAMVMCGQGAQAARLYGFATAHWWHLFPGLNQIEARELRCARLLLHMSLGGAHADALRTLGRGLNLADAVALALEGG